MQEIFEKLSTIDLSDYIETKEIEGSKKKLSYLSWANAWTLLVENYPNSNYTVHQYEGKPYIADSDLGYMVHTSITIEDITKDMYLPVLDSKNKAMFNREYTYTTKYGSKTVNRATMFDINTAIMRCLVKNMALFGLGLSLYRGEDIATQEQYTVNIPPIQIIKKNVEVGSDIFYKILEQVPTTPYDKLIKMVKTKYEISKEVELAIANAYNVTEELEEIQLED